MPKLANHLLSFHWIFMAFCALLHPATKNYERLLLGWALCDYNNVVATTHCTALRPRNSAFALSDGYYQPGATGVY